MYTLIAVVSTLVAVVSAKPQFGGRPPVYNAQPAAPGQVIPIVSQTQDGPNPDGSYKWSFESGNGISAQEEGYQKQAGEGPGSAAQGSYSYTAPDGQLIQITYISDENGFQAQGAAIPTPPPIPPAILKALEWNAAHPEQPAPGGVPANAYRG